MRLRYLVPALLAVVALAVLACNGGGSGSGPTPTPSAVEDAAPSPSPAAFPVTVTDSNGKQITFQSSPEGIVALAPSFVEILFAIGAGDAVVAVDDNTDFPPEAATKTKLSGFEPSLEGIAALEPDLVIIFFDPGGLEDALEGLGIPVLFLETPASIQGVFDQIELLSSVAGRLDEAENLIADMEAGIDAIVAELADVQEDPRIFHELDSTFFTVGPGSFVGDLYDLLNAQNIADATGEPFPQMSAEAIIEADPEVIILADAEFGESAETVKARPGWENVSAVRNDRIFPVDPGLVSSPGPRLVEGLETLAAYLYPELFP
jgi:iron complex transport system substrate-binding protein